MSHIAPKPVRRRARRHVMRPPAMSRLGARLLNLAAVVGFVCISALIASLAFGVTAVIVQSGSMSPAIPQGSLLIEQRVGASELVVGDVVTLPTVTDRNQNVTHRITEILGADQSPQPLEAGERSIRLKGDANDVPDAQLYVASEANRVILSLPGIGAAIAWFTQPIGMAVLMFYGALMLMLIFRRPTQVAEPEPTTLPQPHVPRARHSNSGARRRRGKAVVASTVAAVSIVSVGVHRADAMWTDAIAVPASLTSWKVPVASHLPTGGCDAENFLLASKVTLSWKGVEGVSNPLSYRYELRVVNGTSSYPIQTHAHNGSAGATQSAEIYGSTINNLLNLDLLSWRRVEIRVTAKYVFPSSTWESTPISFFYDAYSTVGLITLNCV